MDEREILQKIVDENGSCSWIDRVKAESTCAICPMSKLKKKENSENHLSCIEALGVQNLSPEEQDAKYKEVATRILLDKNIEDLLKETDGSK